VSSFHSRTLLRATLALLRTFSYDFCLPTLSAKALRFGAVCPPREFVCSLRSHSSSGQILLYNILWTAWAISMKLMENIYWPLLITWLDVGGQKSRSYTPWWRPRGCWDIELHLLVRSTLRQSRPNNAGLICPYVCAYVCQQKLSSISMKFGM